MDAEVYRIEGVFNSIIRDPTITQQKAMNELANLLDNSSIHSMIYELALVLDTITNREIPLDKKKILCELAKRILRIFFTRPEFVDLLAQAFDQTTELKAKLTSLDSPHEKLRVMKIICEVLQLQVDEIYGLSVAVAKALDQGLFMQFLGQNSQTIDLTNASPIIVSAVLNFIKTNMPGLEKKVRLPAHQSQSNLIAKLFRDLGPMCTFNLKSGENVFQFVCQKLEKAKMLALGGAVPISLSSEDAAKIFGFLMTMVSYISDPAQTGFPKLPEKEKWESQKNDLFEFIKDIMTFEQQQAFKEGTYEDFTTDAGEHMECNGFNVDEIVKELKKRVEFDWSSVMTSLDDPHLVVSHPKAIQLLFKVFSMTRSDEDGPFPLKALCSTEWKNGDSQFDFLRNYIVSVEDHSNLCSEVAVFKSQSGLKEFEACEKSATIQDNASSAGPWCSLYLVDRLLSLSADPTRRKRVEDLFRRGLSKIPYLVILLAMQCRPMRTIQNNTGERMMSLMSTFVVEVLNRLSNSMDDVEDDSSIFGIPSPVKPPKDPQQAKLSETEVNLAKQFLRDAFEIDSERTISYFYAFALEGSVNLMCSIMEDVMVYERLLSLYRRALHWNDCTFVVKLTWILCKKKHYVPDGLHVQAEKNPMDLIALSIKILRLHERELLAQEEQKKRGMEIGEDEPSYTDIYRMFLKNMFIHRGNLPPHLSNEVVQFIEDLAGRVPDLKNETGDFESRANRLFELVYNSPEQIDDIVRLLKEYKHSNENSEQEVFHIMVQSLFHEYQFFGRYPERELRISAVLLGRLVQDELLSGVTLGIALRYVLDALDTKAEQVQDDSAEARLFRFGLFALAQFKNRLTEWPQYTEHVLSIQSFRRNCPRLVEEVETVMNRQHGHDSSSGFGMQQQQQQPSHLHQQQFPPLQHAMDSFGSGNAFPASGSIYANAQGQQQSQQESNLPGFQQQSMQQQFPPLGSIPSTATPGINNNAGSLGQLWQQKQQQQSAFSGLPTPPPGMTGGDVSSTINTPAPWESAPQSQSLVAESLQSLTQPEQPQQQTQKSPALQPSVANGETSFADVLLQQLTLSAATADTVPTTQSSQAPPTAPITTTASVTTTTATQPQQEQQQPIVGGEEPKKEESTTEEKQESNDVEAQPKGVNVEEQPKEEQQEQVEEDVEPKTQREIAFEPIEKTLEPTLDTSAGGGFFGDMGAGDGGLDMALDETPLDDVKTATDLLLEASPSSPEEAENDDSHLEIEGTEEKKGDLLEMLTADAVIVKDSSSALDIEEMMLKTAVAKEKDMEHEWVIKMREQCDKDRPESSPPTDTVRDRIHFIVNNVTKQSLTTKVKELNSVLTPETLNWFIHYLTSNRLSSQANFHPMYIRLLQKLRIKNNSGDNVPVDQILRLSMAYCIEEIVISFTNPLVKIDAKRRIGCRNLMSWFGLLTIAKNVTPPLDLKAMFKFCYDTGRLQALSSGLRTMLSLCADNRHMLQDKWIKNALRLCKGMTCIHGLKLKIVYEVELLFKHINIPLESIAPDREIMLLSIPDMEDNNDFKFEFVEEHLAEQRKEKEEQAEKAAKKASEEVEALKKKKAAEELKNAANKKIELPKIDNPEATLLPEGFKDETLVPNLAHYVVFDDSLALLKTYPFFLRVIPVALDKAIREASTMAVRPCVANAVVTTCELIAKDFVMGWGSQSESEIESIRRCGASMVAALAGSLASFSCKEPLAEVLRINLDKMTANLNNYPELKAMRTEFIDNCVEKNVQLGFLLIQKAIGDKSKQELMIKLDAQMNYQRQVLQTASVEYAEILNLSSPVRMYTEDTIIRDGTDIYNSFLDFPPVEEMTRIPETLSLSDREAKSCAEFAKRWPQVFITGEMSDEHRPIAARLLEAIVNLPSSEDDPRAIAERNVIIPQLLNQFPQLLDMHFLEGTMQTLIVIAMTQFVEHANRAQAENYQIIDSMIAFFSGLQLCFMQRANVNIIDTLFRVCAHIVYKNSDIGLENNPNFDQRPLHRLLDGLLRTADLHSPIDLGEQPVGNTMTGLTSFGLLLYHTRPSCHESFVFAWLRLMSHSVFLPKIMADKDIWFVFHLLLLDLLRVLKPKLRSENKLDKFWSVLYQGTTKLIEALLQKYPEFLSDYFLSLTNQIPSQNPRLSYLLASSTTEGLILPSRQAVGIDAPLQSKVPPRVRCDLKFDLMESGLYDGLTWLLEDKITVNEVLGLVTKKLMSLDEECGLIPAIIQHTCKISFRRMIEGNSSIISSRTGDFFVALCRALDPPRQFALFHAILIQLRFPNVDTLIASRLAIYLLEHLGDDSLRRQFFLVLLGRFLKMEGPFPWGVSALFFDMITGRTHRNAGFDIWRQDFARGIKDLGEICKEVMRRLNGLYQPQAETPAMGNMNKDTMDKDLPHRLPQHSQQAFNQHQHQHQQQHPHHHQQPQHPHQQRMPMQHVPGPQHMRNPYPQHPQQQHQQAPPHFPSGNYGRI